VLDFFLFCGVLGAVILGGVLLGALFYALAWVEIRQRKGMTEDQIPAWAYMCLIVPPLVGAAALWTAFHH
jgi:hypothetical protein